MPESLLRGFSTGFLLPGDSSKRHLLRWRERRSIRNSKRTAGIQDFSPKWRTESRPSKLLSKTAHRFAKSDWIRSYFPASPSINSTSFPRTSTIIAVFKPSAFVQTGFFATFTPSGFDFLDEGIDAFHLKRETIQDRALVGNRARCSSLCRSGRWRWCRARRPRLGGSSSASWSSSPTSTATSSREVDGNPLVWSRQ